MEVTSTALPGLSQSDIFERVFSLLNFILDKSWLRMQICFRFPQFPFVLFFPMVYLSIFSGPRAITLQRVHFFACVGDESKENDDDQ
jgi:hypothetical protein